MILHIMKSVKESILLVLYNCPLSKSESDILHVRDMDITYERPSIKCSNCEEFEHYNYQCPSKSQHTDNAQIDDIDNSKIVEDVHILSEATSDVDELVKASIPTFEEIHVHEENITDI